MYINKIKNINKIKYNKIKALANTIVTVNDYKENLNLYTYIFKKEFYKIMNGSDYIPEYSFKNEKLCLHEDIANMFNELYTKHIEIVGYLNDLNGVIMSINNSYYTNMINIFNSMSSLNVKCNSITAGQYTIVDNFENTSTVQRDNINSAKNRLELLSTSSMIELNSCCIEVLDGSNGFPGNTHIAYIENSSIIFDGEKDLKIDLNNIFSNNKDFEYELFKISKDNYANANGYGYKYDEGMPYITLKNEPLKLALKITLPYEVSINSISFNDNQGDCKYLINEISAYSSNLINNKILATNVLSNKYNTFSFNNHPTRDIVVKVTQNKAYKCKIGHYYNTSDNSKRDYYSSRNEDVNIGSVSNLGIGYNDGEICNPKNYITKNQFISIDENAIKNNLFNLDYQLELINAERLSISLNNLQLGLNKYAMNGSLIKTYNFDYEIGSITFDAAEYIPSGLDSKSIKYYISFNKINWIEITPNYRCGFNDIGIIKINDTDFLNANNTLSLNLLENPKQFDLKIALSTTNSDYSPIINNLEFKVNKVGD